MWEFFYRQLSEFSNGVGFSYGNFALVDTARISPGCKFNNLQLSSNVLVVAIIFASINF